MIDFESIRNAAESFEKQCLERAKIARAKQWKEKENCDWKNSGCYYCAYRSEYSVPGGIFDCLLLKTKVRGDQSACPKYEFSYRHEQFKNKQETQ